METGSDRETKEHSPEAKPEFSDGGLTDDAIKKYMSALLQEATEQPLPSDPTVDTSSAPKADVRAGAPSQFHDVEIKVNEKTENESAPSKILADVIKETEEKNAAQKDVDTVAETSSLDSAVEQNSEASAKPEASTTEGQSLAADNKAGDSANLSGFRPISCEEVFQQSRFECLLFSVASLKMAVPLVSLGAIVKIENKMTHLAGQLDWMLGLYQGATHQIRVVNTAKWVMPDQYRDEMREDYKYILTFNNSPWGLACHELYNAVSLSRDEVRWRGKNTKRVWLAGTIVDQMCALIDLDKLASGFEAKQAVDV